MGPRIFVLILDSQTNLLSGGGINNFRTSHARAHRGIQVRPLEGGSFRGFYFGYGRSEHDKQRFLGSIFFIGLGKDSLDQT